MDLGLNGKSVLITGASKGIGRATAEAFAREGAGDIHITARSGDALDEAARAIETAHGGRVHPHALDLTDEAARAGLVAQTIDVDILVNNAGAIPSGSMDAVDDAAWVRRADRVNPFQIRFDYIAGACGNSSLMTLSRALGGRSLDHGVRVVAVNPGPVDTGRMETMLRQRAEVVLGDESRWGELLARFPGGRAATADEVADLIVFCASARAGYLSGCVVTLDGGITSRRSVV